MAGEKKEPKILIAEYYYDFLYGICSGPAELLEVQIDDKELWISESGASSGEHYIDERDLFGGEKGEGGLQGTMTILPGGSSQTIPEWLKALNNESYLEANIGLTTADGVEPNIEPPAYRGIMSVAFGKRFMIALNQPYFRKFKFKVHRAPDATISGGGTIVRQGTITVIEETTDAAGNTEEEEVDKVIDIKHANPAHIIFDCLTNKRWGMSASVTQIDVASFQKAADILSAEKFGISLKWVAQTEIQEFIETIISHIEGFVFLDPNTGKFKLVLARNDYGLVDDLIEINPSNCDISSYERASFSELSNQVIIKWKEPQGDKDQSVTIQDNGAVAIAGAVVSTTLDMPGIRDPKLAEFVAQREIRSAAYPLAHIEVELNRTNWDIAPGDVVNFAWPERGIDRVTCRVMTVDYGSSVDSTIKASLVEDIFSKDIGDWNIVTSAQDYPKLLKPLRITSANFIDTPYFALSQRGVTPEYPQSFVSVLISHANTDSIRVFSDKVLPNGTQDFREVGYIANTPKATLLTTLSREVSSTISMTGSPSVGGLAQIGDEIIMFEVDLGSDQWTISRGMHDTNISNHSVGEAIWLSTYRAADDTERSVSETVQYKLVPANQAGSRKHEDMPFIPHTLGDRAYRPYRPANVEVDGNIALQAVSVTALTPFDITWSNRNRLTEDGTYSRWADGNSTPEVNQKTQVLLNGVTYPDIIGTTLTVPSLPAGNHTLEIWSSRDGFDSIVRFSTTIISA